MTRPTIRWRRFAPLLLLVGLAVCAAAPPVWAVTVIRKGSSEPIRGLLIRQDDEQVVLEEVLPGGQRRERILKRSEIDLLIESVDRERLQALDHQHPKDYRDYAEELAEKRVDPDAQATGIRLYLMAAYLDPENLGRSSLLGMTQLARSPEEERKFRAMVYLLDPDHDRRVLASDLAVETAPTREGIDRRKIALQAVRLLRQNKKREALALAQRGEIQPVLDGFASVMSYGDFVEACATYCRNCQRTGKVECPDCHGKGRILSGGRSVACPRCRQQKKVTCPSCRGNYRHLVTSPRLLSKILTVELALMKGELGKEAIAGQPPASWSQVVASGRLQAVPSLTLETLTEFDPRKCHFREGKWVEP